MRQLDRDLALWPAEIQKAAQPSPKSDTLDREHLTTLSGPVRPLADGCAAWLCDGSRMSREAHVRFYEGLGWESLGPLTSSSPCFTPNH